MKRTALVICLMAATALGAQAQEKKPAAQAKSPTTVTAQAAAPRGPGGKEYPDGHGGTVYFPLGDRSFADEVVSFASGNPGAAKEADRNPKQALGPPNYDKDNDTNFLTLGCGGSVVLRFVDNALADVPGPDLYVFEIGPDVEATAVAISEDGKTWVDIGKIEGGRSDVDIHPFVKPGQSFHLVRLTDLKTECSGEWPGADIDAVGAIGSALQFSLNSGVLFDTDQYVLKPAARTELDKVVEQIKKWPGADIVIEGHTDSVGTDDHNQVLSRNRAASVKAYFESAGLAASHMEVAGYGASRPVAPNDTDKGRMANRRVEVVVFPSK
jgi:outer membrane protein OmpA-like peptidoglycan-associated protein